MWCIFPLFWLFDFPDIPISILFEDNQKAFCKNHICYFVTKLGHSCSENRKKSKLYISCIYFQTPTLDMRVGYQFSSFSGLLDFINILVKTQFLFTIREKRLRR